MPRYFIDLRNKGGMARDEEGSDFAHLEDALTEAKDSARDLVRQFMDTAPPWAKPVWRSATPEAAWSLR